MSTLATLVVKLVGDIGDFVGGMDKAAKKAEEAGGSILSSIGGGLSKVAGIAAGAAVAGIGAATAAVTGSVVAVNNWAGELDALGDVLGTSANESAGLAVAIRGVGGDVGAITGQMAKFVGGLRDGNGKLSEGGKLMENLGVSFQDANGQLLPTTDILTGIANKFATMPDGLQKTEMLTTLFGKSGKELGDTLNALANGGLSAAEQKAKDLGLAIGDEGVNRSIEFGKGMATIQMAAQGLLVTLGNQLMPVIVPLIQQFAAWAVDVMPQVGAAITTAVGWIQANLLPAFEDVVKFITDNVVPVFQSMASGTGTAIGSVRDAWEGLRSFLTPLIDNIKQIVLTVFGAVQAFVAEHGDEIKATVMNAWRIIQEIVQKAAEVIRIVFGAIATFISQNQEGIKYVITLVWNNIKVAIEVVLGIIRGIISVVLALIKGDWEGAWNAVKQLLTDVWTAIKTFVETTLNAIFKLLGTSWDAIRTQVESSWNLIKAAIVDAWGRVTIFFNTLPDQLRQVGMNIINGIVTGIQNAAWQVANALSGIVNSAIDSVKRSLGISSPSKVFEGFGKNMMIGMADGIRRAGDLPEVELRGTMTGITGIGAAGAGARAGQPATGGAAAYVTINFYGQQDTKAARDGTVEGLRRAGLVVVS